MPYYRQIGEIPRKRHTQFRTPEGGLYAEELMGVEGFSADSALLYHRHLPTAIVDAQTVDDQGFAGDVCGGLVRVAPGHQFGLPKL